MTEPINLTTEEMHAYIRGVEELKDRLAAVVVREREAGAKWKGYKHPELSYRLVHDGVANRNRTALLRLCKASGESKLSFWARVGEQSDVCEACREWVMDKDDCTCEEDVNGSPS